MRADYLITLFIILGAQGQEIREGCNDSDEVLTNVCYQLFKTMEQSLYNDGRNLYRLRRAYFYAPNANPILLRVVFNVKFLGNSSDLSYCMDLTATASGSDQLAINSNRTTYTYGWTSSGVFTVFDPLTLNFMQSQFPFAVMRACFYLMTKDSPEAKTFLWDGNYDLPTLYLNLQIPLSCIPSTGVFESVLMDLTSMVS